MGLPGGTSGKEPAGQPRRHKWLRVPSLGWEDPLEEEMATQFQYSCLENPMDREAWQATVHEVTKSQKQLRDFTHFQMRGEGSKEERKQEI